MNRSLTFQRFNASTAIKELLYYLTPLLLACFLISSPARADGPTKESILKAVQQRAIAGAKVDVVAPPAPDALDSAIKAKGLRKTCFCNVDCMGVSKSTNWDYGVIIPTPGKRQQCADQCTSWVNENIQAWAAEQKSCTSFSCGGSSQLSTSDPIGVGPITISTVGKPWCPPPPAGDGACCPPITSEDIFSQFTFPPVGAEPHPFSVIFNPNNTAFNNRMNAFANLAGLVQRDCNPSIVVYTITNTLTNAIVATITARYTGSGAPLWQSSPINMTGIIPNANPAVPYKVNAHAGCSGYTSNTCKDHGFEQTFGFKAYKVGAGGAPAVVKY